MSGRPCIIPTGAIPSDIQISQNIIPLPISTIAQQIGLVQRKKFNLPFLLTIIMIRSRKKLYRMATTRPKLNYLSLIV